jgi:hypothetical protein
MSTTITQRIQADANDGFSNSNGVYSTSTILVGRNASHHIYDSWFLFKPLIPKRSGIVSATLTLVVKDTETENMTWRIYMNDVDDAAAPTTQADHASKTRTTAYTAWSKTSPWTAEDVKVSPDFATPLQEVIDRSGYDIDSNIMVLLDDAGSYDDAVRFYDYYVDSAKAALLSVEYLLPPMGILIATRR